MSSSSNNSWTVLTPDETTAAETLRPLTEGTERQDEPSALTEGDSAHGLSGEDRLTSEETITKPCEEADCGASLPSSAPLEVLHSPVSDAQTEDPSVDTGLSNTEQESFSDSYSHLSPTTEDCSTPPLTTETLGHLDSDQGEEERGQTDVQDETHHQSVSQECQEESKDETVPEPWSPLETPQDPSVQTGQEAEPEVRRRRSLLEKIGRHDEEEEAEEDFQLPQREDESGITLNKCILGAVILLGFGTIFISGVFLDLDEESDYPSGELKDSEVPKKQDWLNPDVAHSGAEAESTELLNKLNKGNEQMALLQAQLQSQNEEVKEAKAQAAGGSAEQLQHEEVEKENTAATTPPGGRTEDNTQRSADQQMHRKDKHDRGVREEWKEKSEWKKEKKQRKDGGKMEGKEKEWKRDRFEGDKSEKKHKADKYSKHNEDTKEWKSKRGDEGKPWKDKNEKKEWTEKSEKKSKHDKFKEDEEWRGREKRREEKHHGEKHKGPGDKEKKKEKGGHKEEYKERHERKPWKEREGHEGKNKRDDKEWNKNDRKKWKKPEEPRQWSEDEEEEWNGGEKKHQKQWREGKSEKHKGSNHRESTWGERKPAHPKPSVGQPEYWSHQRGRLQHSSKPPQPCHSPETCARAEGLRPVPYTEFEAVLQNYLSKAQAAGVDALQTDQLKNLAADLFQNGVFPHDQMSFQDYVEDVGDILEDLVEGEDGGEQNAAEDEMEGFEREVMQKFGLPGSGERGRVKGEWREESGRGRA